MKLFLTVVLGTVLGSAAWATPLDGTKWKVKLTPDKDAVDAGAKEFDDELVFADEYVTATACVPHGFKASVYLVTQNDEVLKWQTVQHSDAEGVANWSGVIDGTRMTGKLIWTRRDGTRLLYTFAGEKAGAPPAKKNDRTD